MQDVSRVTGEPVIINSKIKGKSFVLRGMTFDDLGVLQKSFLRDKKKRIIEAAFLRADYEPAEKRTEIIDKAQAEAAKVAYLSDEEFMATVMTVNGAVEFLWVLFDRQHPGQVTREDIIKMMASKEFPDESLPSLISDLFGGSPEGNLTGQNGSA